MRFRPRRAGAVLAGAVLAAATVLAAAAPAQAIYNGKDADFDHYRFMVSLRLANTPDSPRCGGTLIARDIVLTAAHCVAGVPQGGIVVVVGADIPDWPTAPRVGTLGHAIPETFDLSVDNRDDIAVLRLATPQSGPTVRLAAAREPRVGAKAIVAGFGCTNAPPVCEVRPTTLQYTVQKVLSDAEGCGPDIFFNPPAYGPTTICTVGIRNMSSINRGDSGGPLLLRDRHGGFRQVGVVTLGSDSTDPIIAGFTSIPVEAAWLAGAIEGLRRN
jgi:secreted trypsin-like serine protease